MNIVYVFLTSYWSIPLGNRNFRFDTVPLPNGGPFLKFPIWEVEGVGIMKDEEIQSEES